MQNAAAQIRYLPMTPRLAVQVKLGVKRQTRRLLKPPPPGPEEEVRRSPIPARYGQAGTIVAIKEKWRVFRTELGEAPRVLVGYGDEEKAWKAAPREAAIKYAMDGAWKSGRFMPGWASRLYVELTRDVEIQRLQEITPEDVREEGVPALWEGWQGLGPEGIDPGAWDALDWGAQWRAIWDGLHAAEGLGWEANPWVYRLSFRRTAWPTP